MSVRIRPLGQGIRLSHSHHDGEPGILRRLSPFLLALILSGSLLMGCPKKVIMVPPLETPPVSNPIESILGAFSAAKTLQAKASIRIERETQGEEANYRLQGILFYHHPGKLRVYGYHPFPLPMDLFDALYRDGEFFLFVPMNNRAYVGEAVEFADLLQQTEIRMFTEKAGASDIPNRIRIELSEPKTRIEILLRETSVDVPLPEDSFYWQLPQGVELRSLAQLLRKREITIE